MTPASSGFYSRVLRAVETRWIAGGFDDAAIPALLDAELERHP